jgi:hypothetical protein
VGRQERDKMLSGRETKIQSESGEDERDGECREGSKNPPPHAGSGYARKPAAVFRARAAGTGGGEARRSYQTETSSQPLLLHYRHYNHQYNVKIKRSKGEKRVFVV